MTLLRIKHGALQLARNIIYIPSSLKQKVITYPRGLQIKKLQIKNLTQKEKNKIINFNFISY
tara:strand:+ start:40 stop:225 length:186 start_codon:yes stop_codon:yes gene_type:complete